MAKAEETSSDRLSTAIKEGGRRRLSARKMYGLWWSGCRAGRSGGQRRCQGQVGPERLKADFENELQPIKVSCADHEGTRPGRIQTWDRNSIIAPMVKEAAAKYAAEKKITTGCVMTNRRRRAMPAWFRGRGLPLVAAEVQRE
jgi:hypothetical protein